MLSVAKEYRGPGSLLAVFVKAIDIALGGLLIAAALLKIASPEELASTQMVFRIPWLVFFAAVQLELALGMLLIFRYSPRRMWQFIGILFSIFAAIAFYRAISGYESCGCFGAVKVNPWMTFVLDIGIVGWAFFRQQYIGDISRNGRRLLRPNRAMFACVIFSIVASSTWIAKTGPIPLPTEQNAVLADKFVIVEPEAWLENNFPLVNVLTPPVDISHGSWTVVFFHHDCPKCQEVIPVYEELAADRSVTPDSTQFLLIEVPPFAVDSNVSAIHHTRLPDNVEWFIRTPTEVCIRDGLVTSVSHDAPKISSWQSPGGSASSN